MGPSLRLRRSSTTDKLFGHTRGFWETTDGAYRVSRRAGDWEINPVCPNAVPEGDPDDVYRERKLALARAGDLEEQAFPTRREAVAALAAALDQQAARTDDTASALDAVLGWG